MTITTETKGQSKVAVIHSDEILISNVQDALDVMMTARHETECDKIILRKENIIEDFFDLSTKLAGEVLQKYVNYYLVAAIVGDFSAYTSKSLRDFIYECNKGRHVFFMPDEAAALEKLHSL
ncbi:MAG: DUF4180 domain-containing protein [Oscillospiraceae bacterium]|jgi:UTP-glucose-1-phosphate uridylyltransferase|nr:DUF4180 domain-containing protein [Oscillospiraceae bacterium]